MSQLSSFGSLLLVTPLVTVEAMASSSEASEALAAAKKNPVFVLEEVGSSLHFAVCSNHAVKPWTDVAWLLMKAHGLRHIKDPRLHWVWNKPASACKELFPSLHQSERDAIIRLAGILGVPLSGDGGMNSVLLSIIPGDGPTPHIAVGIGSTTLRQERAAYLAAVVAAGKAKDDKVFNQLNEVIELPVAETLDRASFPS